MPSAKTKDGHICAACFKPATLRCARCKAVWYCSKECQTRDWKLGHRALCRSAEAGAEPATAVPQPPAVDVAAPPAPRAWLVDPHAVQALAAEPLAVPPLRCGLRNIDGWSCFMNAVLQALLAAAPFRTLLLSRAHSTAARGACTAPCALCWLERFAVAHAEACRGEAGTCAVLEPVELAAMLTALDADLVPGAQHDAHEFLVALLRRCAQACVRGCADGAVVHTNAVAQLFGGWLCRAVACPRCAHASTSYERFVSLSADVTGATATLSDAMRSLCMPEALDGDNLYRCGHCGAAVRATTQMLVGTAPPVLVVQLKRFQPGARGKIAAHVAFPDRFSLRAFMPRATAATAPTYRLCAVVVHCDIAGFVLFGHYVAYVRASDGSWLLADDSRVTPVPASQVLAAQAYLLVYQQVPARTRPFTTANVTAVRDALLAAAHPELCHAPPSTGTGTATDDAAAHRTERAEGGTAQSAPQMCPTGCGFYGSAATRGYCSVCFRRNFPAEAKQLEDEKRAREEREKAERLQKQQEQQEKEKAAPPKPAVAAKAVAAAAAAAAQPPVRRQTPKTGGKVPRNAPCPCGSGLRYKECHGKLN